MILTHINICHDMTDKPFKLSEELTSSESHKYHTLDVKDDDGNIFTIFATREQLNQLNAELERVLYDTTYQAMEDKLMTQVNRLEDELLEAQAEVSRLRGED